jgi:hypothetical protein
MCPYQQNEKWSSLNQGSTECVQFLFFLPYLTRKINFLSENWCSTRDTIFLCRPELLVLGAFSENFPQDAATIFTSAHSKSAKFHKRMFQLNSNTETIQKWMHRNVISFLLNAFEEKSQDRHTNMQTRLIGFEEKKEENCTRMFLIFLLNYHFFILFW